MSEASEEQSHCPPPSIGVLPPGPVGPEVKKSAYSPDGAIATEPSCASGKQVSIAQPPVQFHEFHVAVRPRPGTSSCAKVHLIEQSVHGCFMWAFSRCSYGPRGDLDTACVIIELLVHSQTLQPFTNVDANMWYSYSTPPLALFPWSTCLLV